MRCNVQLTGRLGMDPEVFTMNSGKKGANFTFATSERWKDKQTGERKERTTWHRVTVFKPGLVKMIEGGHLQKGQFVLLAGTLQYEEWEGKDGGKCRDAKIVLKDVAHEIDFLDNKRPRDEAMEQTSQQADESRYEPEDDNEIPF
ncbi:single-stranded DNA-binding protein [Caulobacter sp. 17J65-9]|uniref:single-stranded DNA-binding protein n=1 Tax=Caulobacter sp. 17J65-9 TaxID=2709382 RepID=UPI0013CCBFB0|nr:single-stranded DNA-binding protein [Caulobacter sp. 17J65-9]NEX91174.1 single-stranded DNA-binding protein [Caulobacter sp. 17J65-9]